MRVCVIAEIECAAGPIREDVSSGCDAQLFNASLDHEASDRDMMLSQRCDELLIDRRSRCRIRRRQGSAIAYSIWKIVHGERDVSTLSEGAQRPNQGE
jgi:hypothetical protein